MGPDNMRQICIMIHYLSINMWMTNALRLVKAHYNSSWEVDIGILKTRMFSHLDTDNVATLILVQIVFNFYDSILLSKLMNYLINKKYARHLQKVNMST